MKSVTLRSAHARFEEAQNLAMLAGNDFNELIAIGLQELAQGMDEELEKIRRKVDDVEGVVRQLR